MPQVAEKNRSLISQGASAWEIRTRGMELKQQGAPVIDLSTGDPELPIHPEILEALSQAIQRQDMRYPPFAGIPELRQRLADYMSQRFGICVGHECIHIHSGAQNSLYVALSSILTAGDEVILFEPCYPTYEPTIQLLGATAVILPCLQGFRIDIAALRKSVGPKTRAILVNTPCNPSGVVLSPQEMRQIANVAQECDAWIVSDEVYGELSPGDRYYSALQLPDASHRVIYLSSFSKTHAMTGWRLGWTVAPPQVTEMMAAVSSCAIFGTCTLVQHAGVKAVDLMAQSARRVQQWCDSNRQQMVDALQAMPHVQCFDPQAGMFVLVNVRDTGLTSQEFCWQCLEKEHISILDAELFGPCLKNWIRLTCAMSPENLQESMKRMHRLLASL